MSVAIVTHWLRKLHASPWYLFAHVFTDAVHAGLALWGILDPSPAPNCRPLVIHQAFVLAVTLVTIFAYPVAIHQARRNRLARTRTSASAASAAAVAAETRVPARSLAASLRATANFAAPFLFINAHYWLFFAPTCPNPILVGSLWLWVGLYYVHLTTPVVLNAFAFTFLPWLLKHIRSTSLQSRLAPMQQYQHAQQQDGYVGVTADDLLRAMEEFRTQEFAAAAAAAASAAAAAASATRARGVKPAALELIPTLVYVPRITDTAAAASDDDAASLDSFTTAVAVPVPDPDPDDEGVLRLDPDDAFCVVCLDEYAAGQQVLRLPCKHHFCSGCLLHWLQLARVCPLCKQDVMALLCTSPELAAQLADPLTLSLP
ncbi:hypothetical protein H9P43_002932 [Blastocladiella emersonii ATCC 22665]|nr:hypothetical protein H9P43_002932 [Blastocladiella emersonii ATCC 22665]